MVSAEQFLPVKMPLYFWREMSRIMAIGPFPVTGIGKGYDLRLRPDIDREADDRAIEASGYHRENALGRPSELMISKAELDEPDINGNTGSFHRHRQVS
jgi:hypothetical protein